MAERNEMIIDRMRRLEGRGGRKGEIPDGEFNRDDHRTPSGRRHGRRAGINPRRRRGRNVDLDPDRLVSAGCDREGEGVPDFAEVGILLWNQRVGPFSRLPLDGRNGGHVDVSLIVDHDLIGGDRIAVSVAQIAHIHIDTRKGAAVRRHHQLEGFEFVFGRFQDGGGLV